MKRKYHSNGKVESNHSTSSSSSSSANQDLLTQTAQQGSCDSEEEEEDVDLYVTSFSELAEEIPWLRRNDCASTRQRQGSCEFMAQDEEEEKGDCDAALSGFVNALDTVKISDIHYSSSTSSMTGSSSTRGATGTSAISMSKRFKREITTANATATTIAKVNTNINVSRW